MSVFIRANIPFQEAHHLVNPWNDHKKVQISRDGQVAYENVMVIVIDKMNTQPARVRVSH